MRAVVDGEGRDGQGGQGERWWTRLGVLVIVVTVAEKGGDGRGQPCLPRVGSREHTAI